MKAMMSPGKRFYLFDGFRVDPTERLLFKENREVPLTPKVFDTLLALLENSSLTHDEPLGLYQERSLCDDLDHFYVTDAAERFAKVAERFLGSAPSILEAVEIWGHDELRTH